MHHLDIDKENKLDISEIDLLLMIEMGFFSDLKRKKIRFNPRPFSNPAHLQKTTPAIKKENLVDFHLEVVRQIDEIITRNEKELKMKEFNPVTKTKKEFSLPEIVEMREPSIKRPETPTIRTEISPKSVFSELDQREEFFEIEPSIEVPHASEARKEETDSWMLGDKEPKRTFLGLNIKFNTKGKPPEKEQKKINGVTKTKIEIEKTKKEIEAKKKELEETIRKEKEKELELKRAEEEKKKQEKLKKLELKKKMKEERIKERETKKAQKELNKKEGIKLFGQKKEEPEETSNFLENKKLPTTEHIAWDEDLEKIFPIIDSLLDKLPEDIIDKFVKSKDFEIYERVMLKYKSK